jgi:hypothetical protein
VGGRVTGIHWITDTRRVRVWIQIHTHGRLWVRVWVEFCLAGMDLRTIYPYTTRPINIPTPSIPSPLSPLPAPPLSPPLSPPLAGLVRFYPNPYGLRGIEGVSIPSKSKSPPIRINPLQSIWIENNRTSPHAALQPRRWPTAEQALASAPHARPPAAWSWPAARSAEACFLLCHGGCVRREMEGGRKGHFCKKKTLYV